MSRGESESWDSEDDWNDYQSKDGVEVGANGLVPVNAGVAYYPLDGDVLDVWNNNDGTNSGVSFVDDSQAGQAGEFERVNEDYIDVPDPFPDDGSARSVTAWIKPVSDGSSTRMNVAEIRYFGDFVVNNGELYFRWNDGTTKFLTLKQSVSLNTWYFGAIVYTGSENDRVPQWLGGGPQVG